MTYRDERDALQARVGDLEEDLAQARAEADRLRAEAAARAAEPEIPGVPMRRPGRAESIASLITVGLTHVAGFLGFVIGMQSCLGPGSCSSTEAVAHEQFTISFAVTLGGSLLALFLGALALSRAREPGIRTAGIFGIVGAIFGLAGSLVLFLLSAMTTKKHF